ncbi:VanW family protein [Mycoplasma sp. P36-A1]|uniref:VanW family protein n=1 Tax=Mycoplasma sp. P36-A1 TaxID=3252900 RepID=UPI003C2B0FC5
MIYKLSYKINMARLLLTQVFPWLWPIREKQKKYCFYMLMKFDTNKYSLAKDHIFFNNLVYECKTELINLESGYDIKYQHNKVHNLKIAAKAFNGLIIKPNETFSFWKVLSYYSKNEQFKEGLNVIRNKMSLIKGGGLCQVSNMIYEVLLNTELTITQRQGHDSLSFPILNHDNLQGIDATVNEGWLDLKAINSTINTYQLKLDVDNRYLKVAIYSKIKPQYTYKLYNNIKEYLKIENKYYFHCSLDRKQYKNNILHNNETIIEEYKEINFQENLIPKERIKDHE